MQENDKMGTTKGCPNRKYIVAGAFFAFGLLLVTVGFWKALLVVALTALGAFLGSRTDLRGDISTQVNRVFPPKGQKVTYDPEELEKIKKTLEQKQKAEEAKPEE